MSAIVPAILPASRLDLEEKLNRIRDIDGVTSVQIDVVDGKYASPATWPYRTNEKIDAAETLLRTGKLKFEVDLMVAHPEEAVAPWIALGASRVTIHIESAKRLTKLLDDIHTRFGHDKAFAPDLLSLGIAIGIDTDLSILEPHLAHADYVQFMGIRSIGKQGQPFDPSVLTKIAMFRRAHPDMDIQVDGGVSRASAAKLLAAGVDRLVVGSALLKAADIQAEFDAFSELTEEHGIYE